MRVEDEETGSTAGVLAGLRRKRRANVRGGRLHAHKVLVSPEEEAQLLVRARQHGVSVVRLMVESALSDQGVTATQRREDLAQIFAMYRLLGNIANNMNQLAKVAHATGEVPPELVAAAEHVKRTAQRLDALLDVVK